jgi:hypothetical protein
MDKLGPTVAIGIVFIGILVLMVLSWRRRTRRDAGIAPRAVADTGTELVATDGFYVATTVHERPLERVAPTGLGFRGRARVTVYGGAQGAVSIAVDGSDAVVIPAADVVDVTPATWTIDRVVERDGLLLIAWTAADGAVADSYVRIVDADQRERLLGAIRRISTHDAKSEE